MTSRSSAIEIAQTHAHDPESRIGIVSRALLEAEERRKRLEALLQPFANYACDEPCGCHNCKARAVLREGGGE